MENMNAFYINTKQKYWIEVAKLLRNNMSITPSIWVADPKIKNNVVEEFPNVLFYNQLFATRGIITNDLSNVELFAIDYKTQYEYNETQSVVLSMIDAIDPQSVLSYNERINLYYKILGLWLGIIDYYKPQLVIYPHTPHKIYDFIIYSICKKQQIKTIMFEITPLGRIFLQNDFTNDYPILMRYNELKIKYLSKDGKIELSSDIEKLLTNIQGSYEKGMPFFMKKYYK